MNAWHATIGHSILHNYILRLASPHNSCSYSKHLGIRLWHLGLRLWHLGLSLWHIGLRLCFSRGVVSRLYYAETPHRGRNSLPGDELFVEMVNGLGTDLRNSTAVPVVIHDVCLELQSPLTREKSWAQKSCCCTNVLVVAVGGGGLAL